MPGPRSWPRLVTCGWRPIGPTASCPRPRGYAPRLRSLGGDCTGTVLVAVQQDAILGTVMLQGWPQAGSVVRGPERPRSGRWPWPRTARAGIGAGTARRGDRTGRGARASGTWCCDHAGDACRPPPLRAGRVPAAAGPGLGTAAGESRCSPTAFAGVLTRRPPGPTRRRAASPAAALDPVGTAVARARPSDRAPAAALRPGRRGALPRGPRRSPCAGAWPSTGTGSTRRSPSRRLTRNPSVPGLVE